MRCFLLTISLLLSQLSISQEFSMVCGSDTLIYQWEMEDSPTITIKGDPSIFGNIEDIANIPVVDIPEYTAYCRDTYGCYVFYTSLLDLFTVTPTDTGGILVVTRDGPVLYTISGHFVFDEPVTMLKYMVVYELIERYSPKDK